MLLDPFFADTFTPRWIQPRVNPMRDLNQLFSMMQDYFDQQSFDVQPHLGQLNVSKDGSEFQYGCNVGGFKPEELKVDVDGDEVVVQAEHNHKDETQSVTRMFVRRFKLPKGVDKNSIKCDLDEKGMMKIYGQQLAIEAPQVKNVPIGLKKEESLKKDA